MFQTNKIKTESIKNFIECFYIGIKSKAAAAVKDLKSRFLKVALITFGRHKAVTHNSPKQDTISLNGEKSPKHKRNKITFNLADFYFVLLNIIT
jgi:hypothetical protein